MFQIGGIIFVFATVFGGYVLAGGKFDVILHALPTKERRFWAPRSARC
jgi:chemotaxis protein MotA